MSKDSTALATISDLEGSIVKAAEAIADLSEAQSDEVLGANLMKLAFLVQPTTKGIEGAQRAVIPQINIKQKMSVNDAIPENCQEGEMYTTLADHLGNSTVIIPILTHDVRKKWGDDNRIECMSLDGVTGNRYGQCGPCPYGKYVEGQRMQCSKGTTYYATDESFTSLYKIDFLKTSAKAGRAIRRLSRPPALWARKFTLSTEKQKGTQGTYYTFEVRAGEKTTDEERAICDALYDFFKPNYELAQQRARSYVGDSATSNDDVVVTVSDDDSAVPDFSDSM